MPEWLTSTLAVCAAFTVIIGAVTLLAGKVIPALRLAMGVLSDIAGEPARPGVPARAGVVERLSRIEDSLAEQKTQLDAVEHELHPNSGKSLRDSINRLETAVTDHPPA